MAYSQIRVRRLSIGDFAETEKHDARHYDADECPENIDPHRSINNMIDYDEERYKNMTLKQIILKREDELAVKGIKKNSTHAIEIICSISDPDFFRKYSETGFMHNERKYLERIFGEGNVLVAYLHNDESKPHVHYIVLPVKKREVKYKNRFGEGSKIELRLSASDYIDGTEKLQQLQEDYYHHCLERYGHYIEIWRGLRAEEQKKRYVQKTDHIIGKLRKAAADAQKALDWIKYLELNKQIEKKSREAIPVIQKFDEKIEEQNSRRKASKGYNWKKSWEPAEPGWKKTKGRGR